MPEDVARALFPDQRPRGRRTSAPSGDPPPLDARAGDGPSINAPTVHRFGDTLTVDFHEEGAHITLSRWRDARGDTSAEVTIRVSSPVAKQLHQSRLSLTSLNQREQLVRALRRRSPKLPWDMILEQVVAQALDARRHGDRFVNLAELPRDDAVRWVVEGWLPESGPALLYGEGASLKSTICGALAVHIEAGLPFLGIPTRQAHSLIMDYEGDAAYWGRQIRRIARGLGIDPPPIAYWHPDLPLVDLGEELRHRLATDGIGFVVIDSAGYAGAATIEAQPVIDYYRVQQTVRLPFFNITHVSKGGDGTTPYGSIYHLNSARSAIEVRRERADDGALYLGLFHTKLNEGLPQRPLGLKVERSDDVITISRADVLRETETLGQRFRLPDRIENCLLSGALTSGEIATALGAKEDSVERILRRMRGRDRTTKLPDGRWGLKLTGQLSGQRADSPDSGHGQGGVYNPPVRPPVRPGQGEDSP